MSSCACSPITSSDTCARSWRPCSTTRPTAKPPRPSVHPPPAPSGPEGWRWVERIIARVEVGEQGTDTRFIVTNLAGGKAKALYEDVYCRRGMAENHIKSWKAHLAADRTSCTKATANQFRLFLHAGAYWLMWGLRTMMPRRSRWRVAQFDTLRLRLIKIAARVVELKTQIRVHLSAACPDQVILHTVLTRIPRLII